MPLFPHLSTQKTKRNIALSFGLAIVLISAGFALSFYSYIQSRHDSDQIAHTLQVINTLEDVLSLTKDVETGTRGYLLTQQTAFLEPHKAALLCLGPDLLALDTLLTNNPWQQRANDTLKHLIAAKVAISYQQIQQNNQVTNSVKQANLLIGKGRMDSIRVHTAQMIAREHMLVHEQNGQARQSFQNTIFIVFVLSLLTFAVLFIAYNLLNRELQQRAENEQQLLQYEAELTAKIQQLETSNQELERFAFVASHDMQEPLRKIQTFGNLLNQQFPTHVNSPGQLYLGKMMTSADRMSNLIRDLLSFSQLKSQPGAFQPVALNTLIDRVLTDLELAIQRTGATVRVDALPTLDAVPSQVEQLFTNLIGNALKYTRPGIRQEVSLTATPVMGAAYPDLVADQLYYQLALTDNGIGFDEKYLDRIFDVFQRLHAKATYEGTGIGLAICKRVVTYHHGHITARSQEGIGTTFVIILPEKQPALTNLHQSGSQSLS